MFIASNGGGVYQRERRNGYKFEKKEYLKPKEKIPNLGRLNIRDTGNK